MPENIELGDVTFPSDLPVLPLRGVVVFPMMWLPLTVGQERSIRLVDECLVEAPERRFIALVAARDPDVEEPGPDQVHAVGTVAVVHRMLKAPDGTVRLIVQGLERIRITRFLQEQPYLRAEVELLPDVEGESLRAGSAHAHGAGAVPSPGGFGAAYARRVGDGGHQRDQRPPTGVFGGSQRAYGGGASTRESSSLTRSRPSW